MQTETDEEAAQLEEHVVQLRAHAKDLSFNFGQLEEHVVQLRAHVKDMGNCQATKIFLEDLPAKLRAFLTS